jgi:hypothetical protein
MVEVARGMPYRLLWQGLLSKGLSSTPDAGMAFERIITYHDEPDQYSRLLYSCRLSGPQKTPASHIVSAHSVWNPE